LDGAKPEGGGGKTIAQIAAVVFAETRSERDSANANQSLHDSRTMIADVYLNGNHRMSPGVDPQANPQEQAAYADSLQATRDAVFGGDLTHGANGYNQSPTSHAGIPGSGAFCPNSCTNVGSYGPYNNSYNGYHFINTYILP
jgi:hypothetical protein